MRLPRRRPAVEVAPGESELARADGESGVVVGTRDALYVPTTAGHVRVPWERVESASWDSESDVLLVRELAAWGEQLPEFRIGLTEPGRLLELVRERVTATLVLQRQAEVEGGGRGGKVRVVARRAPSGSRPVAWSVEYDAGLDPADPDVATAVERLLREARGEIGQ